MRRGWWLRRLPAEARRWLLPALADLRSESRRAARGSRAAVGARLRVLVMVLDSLRLLVADRSRRAAVSPPPRRRIPNREETVMHGAWNELTAAWRALRRRPRFSTGVVLVLALGVGANAAVYTFVDAMLVEPLAFPEAEELVLLSSRNLAAGAEREDVSVGEFLTWSGASSLEATALWVPWWLTLRGEGEPESLAGLGVTPSFFATLGTRALHGRVLGAGDAAEGAAHTVVLSHGLWQRRFGGDPAVVGRLLDLDGEPREVVGVLPESFRFPTPEATYFIPVRLDPTAIGEGRRWMHAVGRLAPGATLDGARAELAALSARLAADHPASHAGWTPLVEPLRAVMLERVRPALVALQALVAVVLLVAAVDVANLLLARARGRRRELAVRAALGAGRGRLGAELLLEAVLIAFAGAAAGCLLAVGAVRGILALVPPATERGQYEEVAGHAFPRLAEVAVDGSVLGVAVAAALVATLAAGLVAAWTALAGHTPALLTTASRSADGGRGRLRSGLVAAELTLASMLLVAAGLLVRSFDAVLDVDPGFRARDVITLSASMGAHHDPAARAAAMARVLDAVRAVPGVTAAGFSTTLPFAGVDWYESVTVEGAEERAAGAPDDEVLYHAASSGYFTALDVPVLAGRALAATDDRDARRVVVVNRAFAERRLGSRWLDRRLRFDHPDDEPYTVVGVVGDTHQVGLDQDPEPAVYASFAQRTPWFMNLAVRTARPGGEMVAAVEAAIRSVSPGQPLRDVRLLEERIADATSPRRFQTVLVGAFAVLALVLAAMGVYGLVAYSVEARRRELGVRLALGASRAAILRLVLGQGLALAVAGGVLGLLAAAAGSRFLGSLLYGVEPLDLATFVAIPVLLAAVAVLASYLPARRAARLAPAEVLRAD